jgi:hypothetical protein
LSRNWQEKWSSIVVTSRERNAQFRIHGCSYIANQSWSLFRQSESQNIHPIAHEAQLTKERIRDWDPRLCETVVINAFEDVNLIRSISWMESWIWFLRNHRIDSSKSSPSSREVNPLTIVTDRQSTRQASWFNIS